MNWDKYNVFIMFANVYPVIYFDIFGDSFGRGMTVLSPCVIICQIANKLFLSMNQNPMYLFEIEMFCKNAPSD